jgi:hypothetical protein
MWTAIWSIADAVVTIVLNVGSVIVVSTLIVALVQGLDGMAK